MTRIFAIPRKMLARTRRLLRREDGSATVEFAISVPILLSIFIMGMEAGVVNLRQVMLDRALDLTIRDLRLGHLGAQPEFEDVRDRLCENAFLLPNCSSNLALELTSVTLDNWAPPSESVACVDRDEDIAPVNAFTQAGQLRPTLVRACMIVDLMFPTSRLGLNLATDAQGGFQMMSFSLYINEPEA